MLWIGQGWVCMSAAAVGANQQCLHVICNVPQQKSARNKHQRVPAVTVTKAQHLNWDPGSLDDDASEGVQINVPARRLTSMQRQGRIVM